MPIDPKTADLMITDFGAWENTLDEAQRQSLENTFRFEPDRVAAQKRFASVANVAAYTGQDVEEVSSRFEDYYMHAFARDEERGLALAGGVKDANEFYGLLTKRAKNNTIKAETLKSASSAAFDSALRGGSDMADFAAWQVENEHLPEAFGEARKVWAKTRADVEKELGPDGRAAASRAFRAMRSITGASQESDAWINEAKSDLINLRVRSPKAYKLALAAVQLMAADAGKVEKGVAQGMGENAGRVISDIGSSFLFSRPIVEMSQDASEAMVKAGITNAENPEQLAAQIRARREVENDIRDMSRGVIDPVKSEREGWTGWAESAAYMGSTSLPYMASVLIPGGTAAAAGTFTSDSYNEFRSNGWEGADAAAAAVTSGVLQAAVERASEAVIKIPGVAGVLNKFGVKPGSSWVTQFLLRSGMRAGVEAGEEVIQEATTPFLQELAHAIAPHIPDTPEGKHLSDVMGRFFEADNFVPLVLSVLPLGLIGAGMSTSRDMDVMEEARHFFGDKVAADIMAETDAAKRDAMIQEKFKAMPAEEFVKKARTRMGVVTEEAKRVADLLQKAIEDGILPRARKAERGADGWIVEDTITGDVVKVPTREEAVKLVFGHLDEQEQRRAQAGAQLWDELYDMGGKGAETLRAESASMDTQKQAARSPEDAARVARGIETYAQLHGIPLDEARKIVFTVNGFNEDEQIENVRTAVSSVFGRGMNVATVLHETTHGRWRNALETRRLTHGQGLAWVRLAEQATGIDFLPSKDDAQISESMLDEAIVDVTVADAIGRRKDGSRFSAGLISSGMAALARGERSTAKQAGKFATWLKAWRDFWGVVMKKGKALRKAFNEGKLGDDYESFLDELMMTSPQARHEAAAAQEAVEIAQAGNMPFSLAPMPEAQRKEFAVEAFHGTDSKRFDEFNISKLASGTGNEGLFSAGFYFSPNKEDASDYGKNLMSVKLRVKNPLTVPDSMPVMMRGDDSADYWTAFDSQMKSALKSVFSANNFNEVDRVDSIQMDETFVGSFSRAYKALSGVSLPPSKAAEVSAVLIQKAGFDAVYAVDDAGKTTEIVVYDPKNVLIEKFNGKPVSGTSFSLAPRTQQDAGGLSDVEKLTSRGDLFWRVHSPKDEFSKKAASSSSIDGQTTQKGFSTFSDASELVSYWSGNNPAGRSISHFDQGVIAFTGKVVGRGIDGEPLAVPDIREVYRLTFRDVLDAVNPPKDRLAKAATDYSGFPDEASEVKQKLGDDPKSALISFMEADGYSSEEIQDTLKDIYSNADVPIDYKFFDTRAEVGTSFSLAPRSLPEVEIISYERSDKFGSSYLDLKDSDGNWFNVRVSDHDQRTQNASNKRPFEVTQSLRRTFAIDQESPQDINILVDKPLPEQETKGLALAALSTLDADARREAIEDGSELEFDAREQYHSSRLQWAQVQSARNNGTPPTSEVRGILERTPQKLAEAKSLLAKIEPSFSLAPRSLPEVADTILAAQMKKPAFFEAFVTLARRKMEKLRKDLIAFKKYTVEGADSLAQRSAEEIAKLDQKRKDRIAQVTDDLIAGGMDAKAAKSKATLEANEDFRKARQALPTEKEKQIMALRTLDAILSAFDPIIREKVGGFVKLAEHNSDAAREKEIIRRLAKLEEVIEEEAKKHYAAKIGKMIDRYKSQKDSSGRISGKLISTATEQVDYAATVAGLDVAAQAEKGDALESLIEKSDDADVVQDALNKLGILRMFETMDLKDSLALESAADWLETTIADGKLGKKIVDEARKEFVDDMREQAQAQVLDGKALNIDDANNLTNVNRAPMLAMVQRLRGMMSEALWTTAQRLEIIFGEGSKASEYFAWMAVAAANKSNDIKRAVSAQQREILGVIFGSDSKFTHAKGIAKLQKPRLSGVMVRRPVTKDITLDMETLTKLADGTITPETAGIREDELQTAMDEWAASDRKRSVTITQVVNVGTETDRFMSELQGIQWRLWWNQADSKKQMERDGWSDESIKQLDAFLSDEAKALGMWISDSYGEAAKMIDPVYRRLFNAPLPRIKGYAPIYRRTLSTSADVMDLGNSDMNSGLAAGFTKSRVNTTAPLLEIDALAAFLSHWENVSHWVSHAELMRDMKAILLDKNVSTAIRQKKGDGALSRLKKDISSIETNGTKGAEEIASISKGWSWLMQYRAFKALSFRVSPIAKQTAAALNPLLADVPAHNYAAGLSRAFTSPQEFAADVAAMWKSDVVQRRIDGGFSAEARIAQQGASMTGSQAIVFMQAGMLPMAHVDAGWTAMGAAVAFDYYKRSFLSQNVGATAEIADAHATARLERMMATSAQPADIVNRSLIERSGNIFARSMSMFVSEQRKALAIEALAIRKLATGKSKNKALDVQRILVAHFVQSAITQCVAMFLASTLGDDEDEDREWSVKQWALSLSLGPISGLFLVGRGIESIARRMLGLRIFPNNDLAGKAADDLIRGTKSMDELFNRDDAEDVMTSLDALSAAAGSVGSGLFGPAAGAVDVSANLAREAIKITKALSDEE